MPQWSNPTVATTTVGKPKRPTKKRRNAATLRRAKYTKSAPDSGEGWPTELSDLSGRSACDGAIGDRPLLAVRVVDLRMTPLRADEASFASSSRIHARGCASAAKRQDTE